VDPFKKKTMDLKEFWIDLLKRLAPTISRQNFVAWFNNSAAFSVKKGVLTFGVPTSFVQKWIVDKYKLKILQAAQELDSSIKKVVCEVGPSLDTKSDHRGIDIETITGKQKKGRKVSGGREVSYGNGLRSKTLNNKYKLSNFVVGKDNRLPHAACMAVSNMPGGIYNPLFIYGGTGLGKTHLLQAVGNELLKGDPNRKVVYMSAEKFVTEIVEAIGKRYTKSFKAKYRNVDCLILDDIQFFASKDSSQQEFFHTFDELYGANKQILISSDRPPSELDGIEDRLVSRFGMGMVVELLFPDFETRLAILHTKCREHKVMIENEILEFIACNTTESIRELEGILLQVVAMSQMENMKPTIPLVADIMKRLNKSKEILGLDHVAEQKRPVRNVDDVVDVVCAYFEISRDELLGSDRRREYMLPRQICMYLLHHEFEQSYQKIGKEFSGRNHTTVIHACNKVCDSLKSGSRVERDLNAIKREIGL
jgi:chromosomal replication initiator protein